MSSVPPSAKVPTVAAAVGFPMAFALAAFAGAVDVCGLTILKGIFVSFMSGNTTLLGQAVARGDASRAGLITGLVALFVAGTAAGTMLAHRAGRRQTEVVLLAVSAVLALPILMPGLTVQAMTFAMGALNAAMDRAGSVKVSLTYVTGTLVKVGQGLGNRLVGAESGWGWLQQGVSWLGLLGGAVLGGVGIEHLRGATVAALPLISLALGGAFWLLAGRRSPPGAS